MLDVGCILFCLKLYLELKRYCSLKLKDQRLFVILYYCTYIRTRTCLLYCSFCSPSAPSVIWLSVILMYVSRAFIKKLSMRRDLSSLVCKGTLRDAVQDDQSAYCLFKKMAFYRDELLDLVPLHLTLRTAGLQVHRTELLREDRVGFFAVWRFRSV